MKSLVAIALLALTFTTGFTCSKNTPEPAKTEAPPAQEAPTDATQGQPSQEQMAQPPADSGQPADGAGAHAAPAEGEAKQ